MLFPRLGGTEIIQLPLQEKSALITGGSRGIGRAIAIGLASQGAAVVIGYVKNDAAAREVVKSITESGRKATAVQAHLSRPAEVVRLFDEAQRAVGALDVVVANAADIIVKPLVDCSEGAYERIFNINTKGVFFTLKEAARRLRDGGRVIVSSTGGTKMFFSGQSLYFGSKGAVEQFVRALSWELAGRGITVNAISPGPTETDMMQERYREIRLPVCPPPIQSPIREISPMSPSSSQQMQHDESRGRTSAWGRCVLAPTTKSENRHHWNGKHGRALAPWPSRQRRNGRKRATATRRRCWIRAKNLERMFAKRSRLRVKRKQPAMQPIEKIWLRGVDLNHRPLGYEPNELPDCSTPHSHPSVDKQSGQIRSSQYVMMG